MTLTPANPSFLSLGVVMGIKWDNRDFKCCPVHSMSSVFLNVSILIVYFHGEMDFLSFFLKHDIIMECLVLTIPFILS